MNPASQGRSRDWYTILGISAGATAQEIATAVERMTRQASALSVTDPDRSHQLREQIRDIKRDLLSGELERQRYDQSLASDLQVKHPQAADIPASEFPAEPPAAEFPAEPPAAEFPAEPPAAEFPAEPPAAEFPATAPPASQYPAASPPASQYPVASPPASEFPAAAPPASGFPPQEAPTMPAADPGSGAQAAAGQVRPVFTGSAPARGQGLTSRVARFLQTGWTCPACGHGAMPADKFCQKCGSRIQTVAKVEQPPEAVNSGRQSAVCGNCRAAIGAGHAFCTRCGSPRS
jgi:double zinc ribbon protein